MLKRHSPPTRMSISFVSISKPAGPNQFGRCFASVHAENTTSRRALITRERTISRSSAHWASAVLVDEVMIKSFDWDWYATVASGCLRARGDLRDCEWHLPFGSVNHLDLSSAASSR